VLNKLFLPTSTYKPYGLHSRISLIVRSTSPCIMWFEVRPLRGWAQMCGTIWSGRCFSWTERGGTTRSSVRAAGNLFAKSIFPWCFHLRQRQYPPSTCVPQ